jgi:hypothetical protein
MDPFLKPQRGWSDVVPSLHPRDDYHPEENAAIEQLADALKTMTRVFGPYQAKAMIETELDWSAASGAYHPIVCHDGTKISVQTRDGTMCKRNAKQRVYTHAEVYIRGTADPCCQSANDLAVLISKHGGIKYGHLPALDFGRDPALGDRCNDDDAVDHAMRMGRKRKCIPYYKTLRFPVCNWTYEAFSDSDQSQSSVIAPATKYRVRAADPGALTAEEQSDRCFTTSKIVGAHCRDGVHILETVNSVYAGRECHRLVATTHLKTRDDGSVHASIVPTPVVVC